MQKQYNEMVWKKTENLEKNIFFYKDDKIHINWNDFKGKECTCEKSDITECLKSIFSSKDLSPFKYMYKYFVVSENSKHICFSECAGNESQFKENFQRIITNENKEKWCTNITQHLSQFLLDLKVLENINLN